MNEKSANRQLRRQSQFRLKPVYAAVLLAFAAHTAQANPTGASVMSGSAGFATSGNTLTVTNSPGTIINWQGFSIGANEVTKFAQQSASSSVLNRVTGNDPSNILGKLQSNGRVFLINPNGILFGAGAVVDVAGLVASTLNLSDADFKAGNYHFTQVPGAANISNAGNIAAQDHGQVYLIAPNVENSGVITAPDGEILLAAGYSVDLVSTDDPNLRVNITAPAGDATNVGQLIASSGSLGLFGTVVSNSGIVNADSATLQAGKIVFKASQRTEISGTVSANGNTGGNIEVLGDQVGVLDGAIVSANGTQGGGTVLIGGDAHGANPDVANAQFTYVAPTASISADAVQSGNGGKVVVWADGATQFGGNISARGGAESGNGGWVEVSGKQWLGYDGLVNTTAANGMVGTLLLDPTDITISVAGDDPTMLWNPTGLTFTDTVTPQSNLSVTTLLSNLLLTDVTVDTTSSLSGTGDITVLDSIVWYSPTSLTLNAAGLGSINVHPLISTGLPLSIINTSTGSTGNLSLVTAGGNITIVGNISLTGGTFNASAPGATISMTGALSAANFTLNGGTWNQVSATLPSFTINNNFSIATAATFIRALGGNGSTASPYRLTDIYGVQGMGSAGMLGNSYVLANNIDATVTKYWLDVQGAPVGFAPIGAAYPSIGFTGQFDGQGHTISNMYINQPLASNVGLFGYVAYGATISNVGLVNASVSGVSYVGGLVGYNSGGSISNSYSSGGVVSATGNNVGGLVGYNYYSSGTISTSYVKGGSVTGASDVGGLVGYSQYGSISRSHVESVTVTGSGNSIGGLAGYIASSSDGGCLCVNISNSYVNNGKVSGASSVGGLAGYDNGADISGSYVSGGVVSATGNNVGGLVGYNSPGSGGTISASHVQNVSVTGGSNVGGLVGLNGTSSSTGGFVGNTITGSYVSGGTISASSSYVGGLVGYNDGTISGSNVSGTTVTSSVSDSSAYAGSLVGYNSGTITSSYASNDSVSDGATIAYYFGGLVGYNSGSITSSYASNGSVNGAYWAGGLVGYNSGTIDSSYVSSGSVSGQYYIGGLVGNNSGSISKTYASGGTVTANSWVGGLVGYNGGSINNTYASGGTVSGNDYAGGLVGSNNGTIGTSYASISVVSGGSYVGGLAGYNSAYGVSVSANFWNTTAAGAGVKNGIGYDNNVANPSDVGAIGMTDADMKSMANFDSATAANGNVNPNWNISASGSGTIWWISDGVTMPMLSAFGTGLVVVPNVINEIAEISYLQEKPKPEDFIAAEDTSGNKQNLPICN